jgi:hypothetical protein
MCDCVLEVDFVGFVRLALTGFPACILYVGCSRKRAECQTQAFIRDIFNTVVHNTVDKGSVISVSA